MQVAILFNLWAVAVIYNAKDEFPCHCFANAYHEIFLEVCVIYQSKVFDGHLFPQINSDLRNRSFFTDKNICLTHAVRCRLDSHGQL